MASGLLGRGEARGASREAVSGRPRRGSWDQYPFCYTSTPVKRRRMDRLLTKDSG